MLIIGGWLKAKTPFEFVSLLGIFFQADDHNKTRNPKLSVIYLAF